MGTLRGQGRPNLVAVAYMIGAWLVTVPIGYYTIFVLNYQLEALWYSMMAGYSVITIISVIGVLRTNWEEVLSECTERAERKASRVLEDPLLSNDDFEDPSSGGAYTMIDDSDTVDVESVTNDIKKRH